MAPLFHRTNTDRHEGGVSFAQARTRGVPRTSKHAANGLFARLDTRREASAEHDAVQGKIGGCAAAQNLDLLTNAHERLHHYTQRKNWEEAGQPSDSVRMNGCETLTDQGLCHSHFIAVVEMNTAVAAINAGIEWPVAVAVAFIRIHTR